MSNTPKLSTQRPGRRDDAPEPAHLTKLRAALSNAGEEKKIPGFMAPPSYHKALQELKNMTTTGEPVKNLLLEAIDDLVAKYSRGEGRFKVEDREELVRRLESLK